MIANDHGSKCDTSYTSIAKLFQNFGITTSSAAIARYYSKWAMANQSKICEQADVLGLSNESTHELNTLFLPDAIREEMGPALKTSIICGSDDIVLSGCDIKEKLGAVQSAIEIATAKIEEAPGGEANLGYVRLLYDTAIEAGGNSVLDNYAGFVIAVRKTNDYFVDNIADRVGRAVALRSIRTLIEGSDMDDPSPALQEFMEFTNELLHGCFYAGRFTINKCRRVYREAAIAFIDGKIDMAKMTAIVTSRVSRHMGFFFDRAAHDRKAHLLALDPHRMAVLNSIAGFDVSSKRAAIAHAMADI